MAIKKMRTGFTLVELIVVIAIIGVLAAILVPLISGYLQKSKRSALEGDAKQIYTNMTASIADAEANSISYSDVTIVGKINTNLSILTIVTELPDNASITTFEKFGSGVTSVEVNNTIETTNIAVGSLIPEDSGLFWYIEVDISSIGVVGANSNDTVNYINGTAVYKSW